MRSGVALVLMTGLLALLLILAGLFSAAASVSRVQAGSRSARAAAELAAESGRDYAANRLAVEAWPRYNRPSGERGDDCLFRDGPWTGAAGAANPSWSHGEPWGDANADGAFNPGESWTDRDGDGRFSAASGRLRGARFSLKVEAADGKVPVNAGYLDFLDRGDPVVPANGIPDHRDAAGFPYHRGLVHVLNNLGTILRPGTGWTRREDLASGGPIGTGHVFRFSWLGADLLMRRPVGGYPSLAAVRAALKGLGYRDDECDLFEPFLDPGPYGPVQEWGRAGAFDVQDWPAYVPVTLSGARRETLESLWMYLGTPHDKEGQGIYGEDEGRWKACSRTGTNPLPYGRNTHDETISYVLYPDDAAALAGRVEALRAGGPFSWQALYADLVSHADSVFARDWADLGPAASLVSDPTGTPVATPLYRRAWVNAKADLAFRSVCLDPLPWAGIGRGSAVWAGWGIDRDPVQPGVQQSGASGTEFAYRVVQPAAPGGVFDPMSPFDNEPSGNWIVNDMVYPQGGVLTPPSRWDVRSAGAVSGNASAGASGALLTRDSVTFTSQEDFENLCGGTALARMGITVHDPDSRGRHDPMIDDVGTPVDPSDDRIYTRIVTLPRVNRRAYAVPTEQTGFPCYGYSRTYGAIGLASREGGLRGSRLYWPMKETWDSALNLPGTDYWHEADPSVPLVLAPTGPFDGSPGDMGREMTPWCGGKETGFLELPGFDQSSPPGKTAIEFWIASTSPNDDQPDFQITGACGMLQLSLLSGDNRTQTAPSPWSTMFRLLTVWAGTATPGGSPPMVMSEWILPPEPGPFPRNPPNFHVQMFFEDMGTHTRIRLFVNGRDDFGSGPMIHDHACIMCPDGPERIRGKRVDEIRVHYNSVMTAPDPFAVANRFVPRGTFVSPTYVLDAPTPLEFAQWTGVVPPLNVPSDVADPFTVRVEGYSTAPGDPGHPAAAWPAMTLGPSGGVNVLPAGPVKSFRYAVSIDCTSWMPPLNDTPIFESIWFTLKRPGCAPRWLFRKGE